MSELEQLSEMSREIDRLWVLVSEEEHRHQAVMKDLRQQQNMAFVRLGSFVAVMKSMAEEI